MFCVFNYKYIQHIYYVNFSFHRVSIAKEICWNAEDKLVPAAHERQMRCVCMLKVLCMQNVLNGYVKEKFFVSRTQFWFFPLKVPLHELLQSGRRHLCLTQMFWLYNLLDKQNMWIKCYPKIGLLWMNVLK